MEDEIEWAGRMKAEAMTVPAQALGRGPSLQAVPKGLVDELFEQQKPAWQLVEMDSSLTEKGREVRMITRPVDADFADLERKVVVHKSSQVGMSVLQDQLRRGYTVTGRRPTSFRPALAAPYGLSAFGPGRRSLISMHVRAALAHWRTR